MIKASRPGLVAIAFAASAVLGGPLLVLWGLVVGYGSLLVDRHGHGSSGIYAVAGGFSKPAVILVMLLCGATGAIVTHDRLKR